MMDGKRGKSDNSIRFCKHNAPQHKSHLRCRECHFSYCFRVVVGFGWPQCVIAVRRRVYVQLNLNRVRQLHDTQHNCL